MNEKARMVAEQARTLSPQDRIGLVEDVLDSLDQADPGIDRLWATEARERLDAFRRGDIGARELGDIVARYRP